MPRSAAAWRRGLRLRRCGRWARHAAGTSGLRAARFLRAGR